MKRFWLLLLVLSIALTPVSSFSLAESEAQFEVAFDFVDYQQFSMFLNNGTYRCGTDFSAGEYYIISLFGADALYDVCNNPHEFTWTYERVLRKISVENGQYIKVSHDAIMVPVSEVDVLNWKKYGVYQVGKDIPSGEYMIQSLTDEYNTDLLSITGICGAYQITNNDPCDIPVYCTSLFSNQEYIVLESGQYVVINNARLALISTDEDVGKYNNPQSTFASEGAFSEIEPYIADLGRITDNRKELPNYDTYNDCVIHINGIPGGIDFGLAIFGEVAYSIESLTWMSDENKATFEDYLAIKNCIAEYYGVTDDFYHESVYFECKSSAFSRIICEYTEKERVKVTWVYDNNNYKKEMLAGIAAIKTLSSVLKNPSSLQVHGVSYAKYAYCTDWKDAIGIRIDYSAQNGFGGYNREYYYVWVKPTSFTAVESTISPEVMLESSTFCSIAIKDVSTARREIDLSATAQLVYDKPIDVLNDYVGYLYMTLSEAGFRESEASNTMKTKYGLDNAMFLNGICSANLWYDDAKGTTRPYMLEISVPSKMSDLSSIKDALVEELNGQIIEESSSSLIMVVSDKNLRIKVEYGFEKSIRISLLEDVEENI